VIDINPPVLAGDRAFDLATLLFYHYDHDQIRGLLRARLLDPTGTGRARWTMRWKPVINAFAITFGDRWPAAETY
jgi:hypothetical protein